MPILINSATFTDVFGNALSFYKGNTVDQFQVKFNVSSLIRMSSIGNPLTIDTSLNQVLSPSVSWIEEGFRVGDPVLVRIHNSGGSVNNAFGTVITYVDDVMCDFGPMPDWYDITNNEFITMICLNPLLPSNVKARSDLDIFFNHIKNSTPSGISSLIDGEVTRAIMNGVESMSVGQTIPAALVGNQSGQFVVAAEITRNAQQADLFFNHDITVTFMNSGMYDQAWFFSSEALKIFMKMEWAAVSGEPYARSIQEYAYDGNTGFFNEPHNSSINDSTLIQGINELDYCVPTTVDIIVDGPLADLGIGAAYRSTDSAYYRNRLFPQQEITMAIATAPLAVGVLNSYFNEFGAGYTLEVNSINTVLNTHTINVTFTPNAAFQTFIDGVDDGDRLFYLWVKCGNINHLAFSSQLECAPPVGGPLIMSQDYGYLDHSQNVDSIVGNMTGFVADTEDDVAYLGTFLLDKNQNYESFTVRIEAFNTVTEADFTLQQAVFGFGGVPISGAGVYLLNESANITTELPLTSIKREAVLVLDPSLDTPTQYGVKIYAPWLLDWRYWLPNNAASVDFYPTQDQNWEQYDNLTNWTVRTELVLIKDGLSYVHDNEIIIEPYDNEDDIASSIELIDDVTMTTVGVIPVGNLMRIKSTHVKLSGAWDQALVWGMITIEDFEQAPRWICSSVVDFDNNTANPLTPLSGLLINIQFPLPDTAVLECFFDSNKLNLSNGASITAKIKENEKGIDGFLITETKEFTRSYSVMKTAADTVYSGPLMTIRRQSDNLELDINAVFDGTFWLVDVQAMLDFVGDGQTSNAWVSRWFDQSATSVLPAIQAALNSQPQIVRNGAVIIDPDNGLPALDFDGIDDFFDVPQQLAASTQILHAMQYRRSQGTTSPLEFSIGMAEGNNNLPYCMMHVFGKYLLDGIHNSGGIGNVHLADTSPVIDSFLNVMWRRAIDDDIYMNLNGAALATINGPNNTPLTYKKIGSVGFSNWLHNGLMQELNTADGGFDEVFTEGNMNFRYQSF
jgi:hypothetical protein